MKALTQSIVLSARLFPSEPVGSKLNLAQSLGKSEDASLRRFEAR
jgi:hypothetical protein